MTAFMKELRGKVAIGVVGGSDTVKIKEQLGEDCKRGNAAAAAPAPAAPALEHSSLFTRLRLPLRLRMPRRHRGVRLVLLAERAGGLQGAPFSITASASWAPSLLLCAASITSRARAMWPRRQS